MLTILEVAAGPQCLPGWQVEGQPGKPLLQPGVRETEKQHPHIWLPQQASGNEDEEPSLQSGGPDGQAPCCWVPG